MYPGGLSLHLGGQEPLLFFLLSRKAVEDLLQGRLAQRVLGDGQGIAVVLQISSECRPVVKNCPRYKHGR